MLNKTIYEILRETPDAPDYLQFMGWVYLWGAIFHWVSAVLNCERKIPSKRRLSSFYQGCNFLRYVTLFSCNTFGFYVSWVYLQYGVQVVTRQFPASYSGPGEEGALVGIICALLMVVAGFSLQALSQSFYFHRQVRRFFADYGMPIALVASSAVAYWGRLNAAHPTTLPVGGAFDAAGGRSWLVKFWLLDGKWVGMALPFGLALWILFFFDHNVSVCENPFDEFPNLYGWCSLSWHRDRSSRSGSPLVSTTISSCWGSQHSLRDFWDFPLLMALSLKHRFIRPRWSSGAGPRITNVTRKKTPRSKSLAKEATGITPTRCLPPLWNNGLATCCRVPYAWYSSPVHFCMFFP